MSNVKMFCDALPNIPWQEKPADATGPVWRYSENPIIDRNPVEGVARIFNSAVVPYEGKFIGVFRGEQVNGVPYIYLGHSEDAIHWTFDKDKIPFVNEKGEPFMPVYAYDPRLVKVEDTYYIIWCQDFYGASIGIAKTTDFKTFVRIENPFIPFNRNAVLFPRKINGMYTLLSRPSDSGHTPFGDIFLSQSPDMEFWGPRKSGTRSVASCPTSASPAPPCRMPTPVASLCTMAAPTAMSVWPSPPWTRWWITSRPTITQAPPITRWASAKRQAQPSLSMLRIAISAKRGFTSPTGRWHGASRD